MNKKSIIFILISYAVAFCATAQSFEWKSALPAEQGFSEERLYVMRDTLAARGTEGLLIIRNDHIVFEWYAPGWNPQRLHYTASLAKALVGGTSLCLALSDGRLEADDSAFRFVPQWKDDPQKSKITIRQLASHSSGIEDAEITEAELSAAKAKGVEIKNTHMDIPGWKGAFWRQDPDPFTLARDKAPVISGPGTAWHYSNPGMAMLAYAVTASYRGTRYHDIRTLLGERIMKPLGIRDNEWSVGYDKTFNVDGLALVANWGGGGFTPRAVAKVGRLMMHKGNWEGHQIIKSKAVNSTLQFAGTPMPERDDKQPAPVSGMGWYNNFDGVWRHLPRDAFMGAGAGNQVLIVVPSLDLIIVRMGKDMYDPSKGEGFWFGIVNYLADPVMEAFVESPYPKSDVIKGIEFAPDSTVDRHACESDNWPLTWADDDNLYAAYGDGWGFEPRVEKKLSLGLARIGGSPGNINGINIRSKTGEHVGQGRSGMKASGLLMVEGVLYLWLRNVNGAGEQTKLAWSKDHGKTWKYADWKFTSGFGCPTFLNFGRNYANARDTYVYIYSHDESDAYKPADRMVLARVPSDKIVQRNAYLFFKGLDAEGSPLWTKDVGERGAVFVHPGSCYRSGITYDAGLKRYLWCQTLEQSRHPRGVRFQGGFGIYEAPEPWGPWRTVWYTKDWDMGPGEASSIPTKWMSEDGRRCYLVFSGNDCFSVRGVTFITNGQ